MRAKKRKMEFIITSNPKERRKTDYLLVIREEAPGALKNGTRIEKCRSEEGDNHKDGALGVVIGSFFEAGQFFYFIEWDDMPRMPMGTMGTKVRERR